MDGIAGAFEADFYANHIGNEPLGPSGHSDSFTRDNLPPADLWPRIDMGVHRYPEWLNAGYELTDRMVERGFRDRIALIGAGRKRSYGELAAWTNRLAHALVEDYGIRPGNRVLIRSANTPAMVACWLAATKAGAVVINTMPLLRAGELAAIMRKAQVKLALCDTRLLDELALCEVPCLEAVVGFDGSAGHDAPLDRAALAKPAHYEPVRTGRDDVALLGFTSGTTGTPKATMHFHRDLLVIADAYAAEVLQVQPDDIFAGSPPLGFTFGLGGLAIFPLRFGAAACLFEDAGPKNLLEIIHHNHATICFTAPTAYRMMLDEMEKSRLDSLRLGVSAGETLPAPVYDEWRKKTGLPMLDGIGATEMLHVFISNRLDGHAAGVTGRPLVGYEAKIVDDQGRDLPAGVPGHLAVRGPVGCRYLDDIERQKSYVKDGWNITGDVFLQDKEGRFRFQARADGMILSAGYNIAGPEIEASLLKHPAVLEAAVIGIPDPHRGEVVCAHIVPRAGFTADAALVSDLQNFVKADIAPYKYPRRIVFADALPKTESGKIQRFRLREAR